LGRKLIHLWEYFHPWKLRALWYFLLVNTPPTPSPQKLMEKHLILHLFEEEEESPSLTNFHVARSNKPSSIDLSSLIKRGSFRYNYFSHAQYRCASSNWITFQIVGTSKNFRKKKRYKEMDGSDTDESMKGIGHGGARSKVQSFTPSTPPPSAMNNYRTAKRRKGVPHRSPMGGYIIEY